LKAKLWFCVRFSASFILISWLLYSIDFREVWKPISPHGWFYVALLFVVINIDRVLMSYKWRILLKAKNIKISFLDTLRSYYIGTFWGIFLPSTIGGDVVRAYRVSGHIGSRKDIASSVVMERILGAVTGLMMSVICLLIAVVFIGVFDWQLVIGVSLFFLIFLVMVIISFQGRIREWLNQKSILKKEGYWGKLIRVYSSYLEYGMHHGALLRFVAWSVLEQCVPIIGVYLTACALGKDISILHVAIFVPLVMTIAKVPMTLDGFGVREGMYVYLFSLVGISNGDAFVIGLVSHVVANLALLPGFIYSSFYYSPSKSIF
jgi:glycosyltransferase 2 family protein